MSLALGTTGAEPVNQEGEVALIKELDKDGSDGGPSPSDLEGSSEKGHVVDVSRRASDFDEGTVLLSHEEQFPIDPNAEEETQQLTFRAVFVGCCLGGVGRPSQYIWLNGF